MITFDNAQIIEERLSEGPGYVDLLAETRAQLLPIWTNIELDFFTYKGGDEGLVGKFEFEFPVDLDMPQNENWQSILASAISSHPLLKHTSVYRLPNQPHDFYVNLDGETLVAVDFATELNRCLVYLSTVSAEDLATASQGRIQPEQDALHKPAQTNFDLLHGFAHIWSATHDGIVNNFGQHQEDEMPVSNIHISITPKVEASQISSSLVPVRELGQTGIAAALDSQSAEKIIIGREYFDDLGGMFDAKTRLEDIAMLYENIDKAQRYQLPLPNVLIRGAPENDIDSLASTFIRRINAQRKKVDATDFIDKYVGNSQKNVRKIFETAKNLAKDKLTVLWIAQIENLAGKQLGSTAERVNALNQLVAEIEAASKIPNLLVLATTSVDVYDLHQAFAGSELFDTVNVPLPNQDERADIFAREFADAHWDTLGIPTTAVSVDQVTAFSVYSLEKNDLNTQELARLTEGMGDKQIKAILAVARRKRFIEYVKTNTANPVTQADIVEAIQSRGR